MAISVDWPNKIINVPLSDLTLASAQVYTFDLNDFRLALKDLEDGPGMPFPDTHRHATTSTLGGVTFARVVEIINGYTVTFEDGQYAVDLVGANSNISDVTNVNQVSIRSANSAGLVQVTTGSGLSTEQSTQLTQLHAALESAGVFSTAALVNATANLTPDQATQLATILNLAQADEKIRAARYQRLVAGTDTVILDKDVADLGDGEFDVTEHTP